MSIKDLKERLTEKEYVYIVHEHSHNILEMHNMEEATAYAKAFGDMFKVYDHFPYVEYGYEDPYNFTNDWTVTNVDGFIVSYIWDEELQMVAEVLS